MLLAFGLAVVGYILALQSPKPEFADGGSLAIDFGPIDREESAAAGPLELTYEPGAARLLQLKFEQADTSGESDISTRIDAEVYEERKKRPNGEGVRFTRTYERVGASIRENDTEIGTTITDQIETMVQSAREEVEVDAIGKPRNFSWKSVSNPQMRQTLRILRHATLLLHPRPRRGELNVGDRWTYRLSADALESDYVEEIDGEIRVTERLSDTVARNGRNLAVLERSFEVSGSGTVYLPEDEKTHTFELSGNGSGRALFDPEAGVVVESRLQVERTLHITDSEDEGAERSGRIDLVLREKPTPADE